MGRDIPALNITKTGWWTFGMSVTLGRPLPLLRQDGVADLTVGRLHHLDAALQHPATHFNTIFFNVCSADNGQNWSTPWIIDDPEVFYIDSRKTATQPVKPTIR